MRKSILILSALAFGAGLAVASPTSDAVSLQTGASVISTDWNTKIAAAKAVKDSAAVVTLTAQRKAAIAEYNALHAEAVAALINDSIDEIVLDNPGAATWLIKRHLSDKNTVDGVVARVFADDAGDRALAAKLLTISNGSQAYFYHQYYASADELRALAGSPSSGIASAVGKRARDLGLLDEIVPDYYKRCLGLGLVHKGYDAWFNKRVRATWATDRAAALKLLEEEQAGIGTVSNQTPATKARIDQLRELSARFAEIIARG
ncbi:hypothetical protein OPIT5_08355 [Opitutaceae bacterium TAV5]|nr:hypothetical protein OPIT5_08355 [Opitutaceae bacterium TAV5]